MVEVDARGVASPPPRAATPPQAPSQTRSLQASRWWKPGESRKGTVVAISRWSKSPVGLLDDQSHSSSSKIERGPRSSTRPARESMKMTRVSPRSRQ